MLLIRAANLNIIINLIINQILNIIENIGIKQSNTIITSKWIREKRQN